MPDLGLSEDVFAGAQIEGAADLSAALAAQHPEAETAPTVDEVVYTDADAQLAAPDAEPGPRDSTRPRRRSARPSSSRRRSQDEEDARRRGGERGSPLPSRSPLRTPPRLPTPDAEQKWRRRLATPRAEPSRRRGPGRLVDVSGRPGSLRRAHRRPGRRQVRGAARRWTSSAPPRSRPTRSSTSCSRPTSCASSWSSASAPTSRPTACSTAPRSPSGSSPTSELREWLEGLLWPRVGERVADVVCRAAARPTRHRWPRSSRCRCCSRRAWRTRFDHTLAVIADEDVREQRAGARGHAALASRTGRQLPQEEKAQRADFVVRNDGSLEELKADAVHACLRNSNSSELRPPPALASAAPAGAAIAAHRRAPAARAGRDRARGGARRRRVRRWSAGLGPIDDAVREITLPLRHEDIIRQQAADKGLDPALSRR